MRNTLIVIAVMAAAVMGGMFTKERGDSIYAAYLSEMQLTCQERCAPTLLLYGVSDEPFTQTDTATARSYSQQGNRVYINAVDGRNIFAAWVMLYKPIKEEDK